MEWHDLALGNLAAAFDAAERQHHDEDGSIMLNVDAWVLINQGWRDNRFLDNPYIQEESDDPWFLEPYLDQTQQELRETLFWFESQLENARNTVEANGADWARLMRGRSRHPPEELEELSDALNAVEIIFTGLTVRHLQEAASAAELRAAIEVARTHQHHRLRNLAPFEGRLLVMEMGEMDHVQTTGGRPSWRFPSYSDWSLVLHGRAYPVHRCFLAASSDFFRSRFDRWAGGGAGSSETNLDELLPSLLLDRPSLQRSFEWTLDYLYDPSPATLPAALAVLGSSEATLKSELLVLLWTLSDFLAVRGMSSVRRCARACSRPACAPACILFLALSRLRPSACARPRDVSVLTRPANPILLRFAGAHADRVGALHELVWPSLRIPSERPTGSHGASEPPGRLRGAA